MSEVRTLMENYWICKEEDKEAYYRVKRDIPVFQRFVREQLGWKLIHTEHLIKLEKIPAHAESFMGIQEFSEIRDYVILCAVLMFLEDREEQEQFLLSELIDFVETCLKQYMEIDWTSFSQRKSLVRVLQYMEQRQMLRVFDGNSEAFGTEASQEVLYENTGYSKYFATSFPVDISGFRSWEDFETVGFEEISSDRGNLRINRVYRQLAVCPVLLWEETNDPDALYLKNQRTWISRYMQEQLGGRLDIHKNAAFWMLEDESYGKIHPRDAMLPELVLLVCTKIQEQLATGVLQKQENERILIGEQAFNELVLACREQWQSAWSKEYREMEPDRMVKNVTEYMIQWMLLVRSGEGYEILPSVGKLAAQYPADYRGQDGGTA
jgi:uncharacterized protein (TIGR02678 family)